MWSTSTSANCGVRSVWPAIRPSFTPFAAPALCSMWAIELFRSATFRLAILFALAVSVSTAIVFVFIYWQVATFDVERLNAILVGEVARAVTQPEDRLQREIELRFTSDLRRLDYAALFDQSGKLQYGNVEAIPEGLPIDGKSHTVERRKLHGDDAGTEPVVFVAGQSSSSRSGFCQSSRAVS